MCSASFQSLLKCDWSILLWPENFAPLPTDLFIAIKVKFAALTFFCFFFLFVLFLLIVDVYNLATAGQTGYVRLLQSPKTLFGPHPKRLFSYDTYCLEIWTIKYKSTLLCLDLFPYNIYTMGLPSSTLENNDVSIFPCLVHQLLLASFLGYALPQRDIMYVARGFIFNRVLILKPVCWKPNFPSNSDLS